MNSRLFALALASCAFLPAQDKPAQDKLSPFRFVPADAKVVVRFAAPAKWQKQFEATQVKQLLAAPALEPVVGMASQGIDAVLAELRSSGSFDADLIDKLLKSYTGDLVVAVTLDADSVAKAIADETQPHFGVVVALTPDGSYDLGKLAAAIEKFVDDAGGELRDLKVGDHRLRATDNEDEDAPDITLPSVIDGQLVFFLSDDIAKFAAAALGNGPRFVAPAGDPSLFVHADLGAIAKTVAAIANESGEVPFDLEKLLGALGVSALDSASFTVGADGKQLAAALSLAFREGDRGIFGMFAAGKGAPKLLRYVPADAQTFSVLPIDCNALHDTVARAWQAFDALLPMTWAKAQEEFKENLKVRLKEDLFDHLGGEVLTVQDVAAAITAGASSPDDPGAALAGTCFAIALRDGKAFDASVETALRARGLHAARKTDEYQGTKVHSLNVGGVFEVEYAITDDLLLLGLGGSDASKKSLRSVLDAHAKPAAAGELPAHVKARVQAIGGDWSGISVSSMSSAFSALVNAIEMAVRREHGGIPPPMKLVLGALGKLGPELERLGLQTAVSTIRVTSRGIEEHLRW